MKKAQGVMETVGKLTLVLIVLIILLLVGKTILEGQNRVYSSTICQASIAYASSKKEPDFGKACVPEEVVISKDDFDQDAYIDDEVKKIIGEEMMDCWSLSSSGKLMPYQSDYTGWGNCYFMDFSFICSIVKFEDIEPFKGLYAWLISNPRPGTPNPETYFTYLYGTPSKQLVEFHSKAQDEYDTSKQYAVVWKVIYNPYDALNPDIAARIPVGVGMVLCLFHIQR